MTGPFYRKNEEGKLELLPWCHDCAFIDRDETCFMNPCPCMPIDEESIVEED